MTVGMCSCRIVELNSFSVPIRHHQCADTENKRYDDEEKAGCHKRTVDHDHRSTIIFLSMHRRCLYNLLDLLQKIDMSLNKNIHVHKYNITNI